jgi:hypothetical protein
LDPLDLCVRCVLFDQWLLFDQMVQWLLFDQMVQWLLFDQMVQ